jgi:hypothetical protein
VADFVVSESQFLSVARKGSFGGGPKSQTEDFPSLETANHRVGGPSSQMRGGLFQDSVYGSSSSSIPSGGPPIGLGVPSSAPGPKNLPSGLGGDAVKLNSNLYPSGSSSTVGMMPSASSSSGLGGIGPASSTSNAAIMKSQGFAPSKPAAYSTPHLSMDNSGFSEPQEFGLRGLLKIIRMTDQDLNTLALGTDLTTLGLDLNSTEYVAKFSISILTFCFQSSVSIVHLCVC